MAEKIGILQNGENITILDPISDEQVRPRTKRFLIFYDLHKSAVREINSEAIVSLFTIGRNHYSKKRIGTNLAANRGACCSSMPIFSVQTQAKAIILNVIYKSWVALPSERLMQNNRSYSPIWLCVKIN